MRFHVLTLFPEMVEQGLRQSILGRAAEKGQLDFHTVNIRDFTCDRHGKVDDYPYGGGAGMLMQAQPVYDAYLSVTEEIRRDRGGQNPAGGGKSRSLQEQGRKIRTVYVTPQGRTFTQKLAGELAGEEELIFLCGHYEGIDERVLEEIVTDCISIGDYVLTGGELPAMVMIDAIARLVPGVLHNGESAETETFHGHLLEYPQYSRPEVWRDKPVPEVLLSGNHKSIAAWRLAQSLERTGQRRPDLYEKYCAGQKIIRDLAAGKRKYIHFMELLGRGRADIICQQGRDFLLNAENTSVYAMFAETPETVGRFMEYLESAGQPGQAQIDLSICQKAPRDILVERWGLSVRKTCYQACYTRKESLRVQFKDIRALHTEDLDYVAARCQTCERAYLRRRIRAGALYGLYMGSGETPAGFIGIHEDGSMGMLFVDETYRCRGVAMSLESWLINRHLKRGETPYCQIGEENLPALRLQEKLGLYLCNEPMWWLTWRK